GHPFRVHHLTTTPGGAPPAYPAVTERRRLQRLKYVWGNNYINPIYHQEDQAYYQTASNPRI
ncbi:MAG: hypothetical protein J6U65_06910, partial [Bacteroidaceae bacterium]|nr:hypothetical protein [Bacteroidaceae bacterium]